MKNFTWPKLFSVIAVMLGGSSALFAQQTSMSDYVLFGGTATVQPGQTAPPAPGYAVQFGSSTSIQGGAIGSYKLVQSTGNVTVNAAIYSGGRVVLSNSNVVSGRISAANSPAGTSPAFGTGSSAQLGGNIDVNGNVSIGGGTVSGIVTQPAGSTYSGPNIGNRLVRATPNLALLPAMPQNAVIPAIPSNAPDISGTTSINPGIYKDVRLTGGAVLTLNGPGTYVFNQIVNSGTNRVVINFNNTVTGNVRILVKNNARLEKISMDLANGGSANRIYTEVQGTGLGNPRYAFSVANGSSNAQASKWLGTVWCPFAAINIGSGTGSTSYTGALWSGTQVNLQSGVQVNYAPLVPGCTTPNVSAGEDISLEFANVNTLTASSTTAGVSFSWQALDGGVISTSTNQASINVTAAGTYVATASIDECAATDTVLVTGKINNLIGSELKSLYENYDPNGSPSPFFTINNGRVFIDVIVREGQYTNTLNLLQTTPYGLAELISNGESNLIITGSYPIGNLLKLDSLPNQIVYVRPYYRALFKNGIRTSAGDVSMRSNLVRAGYGLTGDSVKIGVISDSYNTIPSATTSPVITNTAAQDISNGDLPGMGNPNGYTKPVNVLKEYGFRGTDEGRAMLQIIHDVAPKSELYFYTGFNTAGDFAKGIRDLRDSGCQVIVDDVTIITEPFLRDGVIAQSVEDVVATGTTYISAAGNFAGKSYENAFTPAPAPGGLPGVAHDFDPGAGVDVFQSVTLQPGNYTIVLQWVDNFYSLGETSTGGTQTDLDLYITPNSDGSGLFGFNRNNLNGDPIEILPFTLGATTTANFVILNATPGRTPARVKFVIFRGEMQFNEYVTGTSTIIGQSNAANCIAVGAARYDKAPPFPGPLVQESFSSIGGTQVNGVVRNKPDLVGPNGVNTTVGMGPDYDNDGYSNFFGTSAAAPHVAAVAALLTEGRKKFLNETSTTPAQMRTLLTQTALDMGTPGFDLATGFGLVNADSAMRTFASPDPSLIQLVVPPNVVPGTDTFQLTITGFNISPSSTVVFRDSVVQTTYINSTTATAIINPFIGNPGISVFTPAQSPSGLDGGSSDTLNFFNTPKKQVTVKANNASKLYAQAMPQLTATVLVDGDSLQNTSLTLTDLGLASMTFNTNAQATSDVGTYQVTPVRVFDTNNADDRGYLELYNYTFETGTFTIEQLPVTVSAENETITYGEKLPNVRFNYVFSGAGIPDSAALYQAIQSAHESQIARDAQQNDILGLVNGRAVSIINGRAVSIINGRAVSIINGRAVSIINGRAVSIINSQSLTLDANGIVTDTTEYELSSQEISNLSFKATSNTLQGARTIPNQTLVNGVYVPGQTSIIDITQENILNFLQNSAQTQMLNGVDNGAARGLIDNENVANGRAVSIINGADETQIVNGLPITVTNGRAVSIINGTELTVFNGRAVSIINGQAVTFVNGTAEPVVAEQKKDAVVIDSTEIGSVSMNLKSLNLVTGLDAGTQYIIPGTLSNSNFLLNYEPGTLTITPAPVQITPVAGQVKVYGDADPLFTYTNNAGLTAEQFSGSLGRVAGENAGSYAYTLGDLSAGPNYALSLVSINTFDIQRLALTVTPDAGQTKVYGAADPVFTYTLSAPLLPGNSLTGQLSRTAGQTVTESPYAFTLGTLSAGNNYTVSLASPAPAFSITQAPLLVRTRDTFMFTGGTIPAFRTEYVTLRNGDAAPGATYSLSPAYAGIAGVYQIITTLNPFAAAPNYQITVTSGKLYVNPRGNGAKKLRNYLDCVEEIPNPSNPAIRFVAHFYCLNDNATPLYVPIGTDNKLTSTGLYDGSNQPVIFEPGRTNFDVPFDGTTLKWELRTFDSNKKSATSSSANTSSSRCSFTTRGVATPEKEAAAETMLVDGAVLYPNPAADRVLIRVQQGTIDPRQIRICDAFGRKVTVAVSRRINDQTVELNISGYQRGIYFVQLVQDGKYQTLRLMKD